MSKIPFSIKFRPQIESGEYKVETSDGKPVRIICWDMIGTYPIVALCKINEGEWAFTYDINGNYHKERPDVYDLYLVTPEEELSEFEIRLLDWLSDDTSGEIPMERMKEVVRNRAAELLSLAREQFIKDGYIIEKKAFHDAVKRVDPGIMEEVSENVDIQIALRTEYEKGRADALKDLPRWRKCNQLSTGQTTVVIGYTKDEDALYRNGRVISLLDLEKLPGFKESSHE